MLPIELKLRAKLMRSLHLRKAAVFRLRDGSYIAQLGDVMIRGRNAVDLLRNADACDPIAVSEAIGKATIAGIDFSRELNALAKLGK